MIVLHKLFSHHSTNYNTVIKISCISFKLNFQIILELYRTNVKINFARSYANLYLQMLSVTLQNIIKRHGICTHKCFDFSYFNIKVLIPTKENIL